MRRRYNLLGIATILKVALTANYGGNSEDGSSSRSSGSHTPVTLTV